MKKTIIFAMSLLVAGASMAQSKEGAEQIQNKKGVNLMPEKGDFGLGFNALPVIGYLGNFLGTGNNNFVSNGGWNKFLNHFGQQSIYGKYMMTDKSALRFNFGVNVNNTTQRYDVYDDTQNHPDFKVEDIRKTRNGDFTMGVGYEWRRGKNRFRAIYGGEAVYSYQTGVKQTYEYGNAMNAGNIAPTSTFNASGNELANIFPFPQFGGSTAERIVSNIGGHTNRLGARAFAGVEYFVAPKICIGTEVGYTMLYSVTGGTTRTIEYYDVNSDELRNQEFTTTRTTNFSLNTDNFNAAVYLMFYF